MQLSTVEEHVQLLERAKALLARERPGASSSTSANRRKHRAGGSLLSSTYANQPKHRASP